VSNDPKNKSSKDFYLSENTPPEFDPDSLVLDDKVILPKLTSATRFGVQGFIPTSSTRLSSMAESIKNKMSDQHKPKPTVYEDEEESDLSTLVTPTPSKTPAELSKNSLYPVAMVYLSVGGIDSEFGIPGSLRAFSSIQGGKFLHLELELVTAYLFSVMPKLSLGKIKLDKLEICVNGESTMFSYSSLYEENDMNLRTWTCKECINNTCVCKLIFVRG
jgi:hypothetical protein